MTYGMDQGPSQAISGRVQSLKISPRRLSSGTSGCSDDDGDTSIHTGSSGCTEDEQEQHRSLHTGHSVKFSETKPLERGYGLIGRGRQWCHCLRFLPLSGTLDLGISRLAAFVIHKTLKMSLQVSTNERSQLYNDYTYEDYETYHCIYSDCTSHWPRQRAAVSCRQLS